MKDTSRGLNTVPDPIVTLLQEGTEQGPLMLLYGSRMGGWLRGRSEALTQQQRLSRLAFVTKPLVLTWTEGMGPRVAVPRLLMHLLQLSLLCRMQGGSKVKKRKG